MMIDDWHEFALIKNKKVTAPEKSSKQKMKDELIERAWDELDAGNLTVAEFVDEVSWFDLEDSPAVMPPAAGMCVEASLASFFV